MRRLAATAFATAVAAVSVAGWAVAAPAAAPRDSATSAVTITNTVTRDIGSTAVDTADVSLTVGTTTNLQGRQEIAVSWAGAHPTGGIVADQNSDDAQREEYPLVLLECRGTDTAADPLTPETCWTQTWDERYQESATAGAYPPYRLDEYDTPAERAAIVGAPSPLPAACQAFGVESAPVQRWVPFDAANGQVYEGGNAACAGEAPESTDVGGSSLPSNETFGVTASDGTGRAEFDVWTAAENASLGCSASVACSLVAVPIMGTSCPAGAPAGVPASDLAACEATGQFSPGELLPPNGQPDLAVSGSLWWTASNWHNRISVPLGFAPSATSCSVTGNLPSVNVNGSELMIQATTQWAPSFCQGKDPFSFIHVQSGEPQARDLVATGGAEAAFTSYAQPGGYGKPVVNAPVAVTGFAISYVIDGSNGQPYTALRLTPRLLAKLLTESYPADLPVQQEDPALADNPVNITMDPEFQALNPGIAPNALGPSEAASELVALSGNSDVMHSLTTYINDNAAARAWLNGTPDQWGMVVNPAYRGIVLPVDQWPLLSTFVPSQWYASDENDCLYNDPVPYQPLVAAPLASLENISQSIQFAIANSTTVCSQPLASSVGEKLVAAGRQPVGHRFLIGVTPLADAARYDLQTAALETVDGTFVSPDRTGLAAAVALVKPDAATGTWPVPYTEFDQSGGSAAYPGTMVVYAAIPTSGLPASDAAEYAAFLRFAASDGQTSGSGVGQLPPGYLPLTPADGLGGLAAYTTAAAADVGAQNGLVPPLATAAGTGAASSGSSTRSTHAGAGASTAGSAASASGDFASGSPGSAVGQVSGTAPAASRPHRRSAAAKASVESGPLTTVLNSVVGDRLWIGAGPLPLLVALSLIGVVVIPLVLRRGRRIGRW